MNLRAAFTFALCSLAVSVTHAQDAALAAATVVVFKSDDPDSRDLAKFYAEQRGIAPDHLLGLNCPGEEEISRQDYDRTIAEPLRQIFRERKWWTYRDTRIAASTVRFVALIKGIPLKIRATAEPYPGDKNEGGAIGGRNEASVDSELSIVGRGISQISGAASNPYFQSYLPVSEGTDPAMLLVCRLDAPAAATVRRMITDAIATEKSGLWGRAYVDGAHNSANGFEVGDRWLAGIVEQMHRAGIPVVYDDSPAIFPNGYPMTDCALYYGWYAGGVAGPFSNADFRFAPGAVAVHIHSFSANTLRDPNANWVGPLLTKGAAASLGNVYEPYLQLTTHLDVLNDRLLHGFTFAESAYMGTPALSWMTVVVGDPLYRPYAKWVQLEARGEPGKVSDWKMYHDFAVQNIGLSPAAYRTAARQAASRARNAPMIEDLGLMEARDGNFASATSHFQQARAMYGRRDDILRVVLEEADGWIQQKKPKRALDLVRSVLKIVQNAPASALLKGIEQKLSPPVPAATSGKP